MQDFYAQNNQEQIPICILFKNSLARAFKGTKNSTLNSHLNFEKSNLSSMLFILFAFNSRPISLNIVTSAILVLPAPVGAVINILSSELNDLSKTLL